MDQDEKQTIQERLNKHIEHNLKILSEQDSDLSEEALPKFPCPGLRLRLPKDWPRNSEEE